MVDRIGKVEIADANTQEEIAEMKPITEDVRRWKLMGLGARRSFSTRTDCR